MYPTSLSVREGHWSIVSTCGGFEISQPLKPEARTVRLGEALVIPLAVKGGRASRCSIMELTKKQLYPVGLDPETTSSSPNFPKRTM
jgi:hypothetical protein